MVFTSDPGTAFTFVVPRFMQEKCFADDDLRNASEAFFERPYKPRRTRAPRAESVLKSCLFAEADSGDATTHRPCWGCHLRYYSVTLLVSSTTAKQALTPTNEMICDTRQSEVSSPRNEL